MNRIFITRHAPVEKNPKTQDEFFDEEGLAACEDKITQLLHFEKLGKLGKSAVILTSNAPRAILTAQSLREGLGLRTIGRTPYLHAAGIRPDPVERLREFTGKILIGMDFNLNAVTDVVLVTHKPLVDAVDHGIGDGVGRVPDDWVNPDYEPMFASLTNGDEATLKMWLR